ncbi:MAG: hypothetical protein IIB46_07180, partial [Nitrospinae bacterium]|nr:hypothetical protein [Nitrospinota bacterium]
MELREGRAQLNYLLTLNIRKEEAFGPLALAFIKEHDLDEMGLSPEEQFTILMATIQALAPEPKRYNLKLELLEKAKQLLSRSEFFNRELDQQLDQDIQKTRAEIDIYNKAMRPEREEGSPPPELSQQKLIVQTDAPEYFLKIAQKRATAYYQEKFGLTKKAKTAQHFSGSPRKFDPDNTDVQKEFSGACAPFMNARTNAFHLMLPFDLKISRKPDEPLDAIMRAFYSKVGYSFPLAFENGKLCSYHDGEVLDIEMDDPNLLFVSASRIKEKEFKFEGDPAQPGLSPEIAYPVTVIERTGTLGPFVQVVTNFKVYFDSYVVSILVTGAPDLLEYGLQGGSGLMTRTHAADKVEAYAKSFNEPWQEGLSYNFVNIHLQLAPGNDTAFVPYNTPLFTVYPTLNRQNVKFESSRNY